MSDTTDLDKMNNRFKKIINKVENKIIKENLNYFDSRSNGKYGHRFEISKNKIHLSVFFDLYDSEQIKCYIYISNINEPSDIITGNIFSSVFSIKEKNIINSISDVINFNIKHYLIDSDMYKDIVLKYEDKINGIIKEIKENYKGLSIYPIIEKEYITKYKYLISNYFNCIRFSEGFNNNYVSIIFDFHGSVKDELLTLTIIPYDNGKKVFQYNIKYAKIKDICSIIDSHFKEFFIKKDSTISLEKYNKRRSSEKLEQMENGCYDDGYEKIITEIVNSIPNCLEFIVSDVDAKEIKFIHTVINAIYLNCLRFHNDEGEYLDIYFSFYKTDKLRVAISVLDKNGLVNEYGGFDVKDIDIIAKNLNRDFEVFMNGMEKITCFEESNSGSIVDYIEEKMSLIKDSEDNSDISVSEAFKQIDDDVKNFNSEIKLNNPYLEITKVLINRIIREPDLRNSEFLFYNNTLMIIRNAKQVYLNISSFDKGDTFNVAFSDETWGESLDMNSLYLKSFDLLIEILRERLSIEDTEVNKALDKDAVVNIRKNVRDIINSEESVEKNNDTDSNNNTNEESNISVKKAIAVLRDKSELELSVNDKLVKNILKIVNIKCHYAKKDDLNYILFYQSGKGVMKVDIKFNSDATLINAIMKAELNSCTVAQSAGYVEIQDAGVDTIAKQIYDWNKEHLSMEKDLNKDEDKNSASITDDSNFNSVLNKVWGFSEELLYVLKLLNRRLSVEKELTEMSFSLLSFNEDGQVYLSYKLNDKSLTVYVGKLNDMVNVSIKELDSVNLYSYKNLDVYKFESIAGVFKEYFVENVTVDMEKKSIDDGKFKAVKDSISDIVKQYENSRKDYFLNYISKEFRKTGVMEVVNNLLRNTDTIVPCTQFLFTYSVSRRKVLIKPEDVTVDCLAISLYINRERIKSIYVLIHDEAIKFFIKGVESISGNNNLSPCSKQIVHVDQLSSYPASYKTDLVSKSVIGDNFLKYLVVLVKTLVSNYMVSNTHVEKHVKTNKSFYFGHHGKTIPISVAINRPISEGGFDNLCCEIKDPGGRVYENKHLQNDLCELTEIVTTPASEEDSGHILLPSLTNDQLRDMICSIQSFSFPWRKISCAELMLKNSSFGSNKISIKLPFSGQGVVLSPLTQEKWESIINTSIDSPTIDSCDIDSSETPTRIMTGDHQVGLVSLSQERLKELFDTSINIYKRSVKPKILGETETRITALHLEPKIVEEFINEDIETKSDCQCEACQCEDEYSIEDAVVKELSDFKERITSILSDPNIPNKKLKKICNIINKTSKKILNKKHTYKNFNWQIATDPDFTNIVYKDVCGLPKTIKPNTCYIVKGVREAEDGCIFKLDGK